MTTYAPLIEPSDFAPLLDNDDLLIVQVTSPETYQKIHLPNAVLVTPSQLMSGNAPARGSVPSTDRLNELMQSIGLTADKHMVVYDDEGGGWAGRMIWTLDYIGHTKWSYLNGGLHAWYGEQLTLSSDTTAVTPSDYTITALNEDVRATSGFIIDHLGKPNFAVWDARSLAEHTGEQVLAQQGGHIPGASHLEWTDLMDPNKQLRLRPFDVIQARLDSLDLSADKTVVTHCQSHHRSGLTYLVGRLLGYHDIRGYDGSWSEWGNDLSLPTES